MSINRDEILNQIKTTLRSVAPGARVILFGSRARGDARDDSDWDILILVDKDRVGNDDFDKIAYPLVELGWRVGEAINPKLYTVKEWLKRHFTPFYKNVENDGIVLL
ncbi:MAG: nucleotidyltransferase domain-containing protein [Bacteroidales bacterium]|nr:nucleotidyltransferase domain-containing protein [Bacteroidales bacterium]